MPCLKRGDIVLGQSAEPDDFDCMRPMSILLVLADGDEQKDPRQKQNDYNTSGSSGEELDVEVLMTKKPGKAAANKSSATRVVRPWRVRLPHYNLWVFCQGCRSAAAPWRDFVKQP